MKENSDGPPLSAPPSFPFLQSGTEGGRCVVFFGVSSGLSQQAKYNVCLYRYSPRYSPPPPNNFHPPNLPLSLPPQLTHPSHHPHLSLAFGGFTLLLLLFLPFFLGSQNLCEDFFSNANKFIREKDTGVGRGEGGGEGTEKAVVRPSTHSHTRTPCCVLPLSLSLSFSPSSTPPPLPFPLKTTIQTYCPVDSKIPHPKFLNN